MFYYLTEFFESTEVDMQYLNILTNRDHLAGKESVMNKYSIIHCMCNIIKIGSENINSNFYTIEQLTILMMCATHFENFYV